jgi:hypothetical protein
MPISRSQKIRSQCGPARLVFLARWPPVRRSQSPILQRFIAAREALRERGVRGVMRAAKPQLGPLADRDAMVNVVRRPPASFDATDRVGLDERREVFPIRHRSHVAAHLVASRRAAPSARAQPPAVAWARADDALVDVAASSFSKSAGTSHPVGAALETTLPV